jgi:hypothetical protein
MPSNISSHQQCSFQLYSRQDTFRAPPLQSAANQSSPISTHLVVSMFGLNCPENTKAAFVITLAGVFIWLLTPHHKNILYLFDLKSKRI